MEFCIAGFLKRGLFAGTRSVSVARNSTRGSCVCLSSVSKSGDKGAKKNFDRKVKKNAKKTTKLDVANLVSSLQSFEKHGRQQASETNERENKNLRYSKRINKFTCMFFVVCTAGNSPYFS